MTEKATNIIDTYTVGSGRLASGPVSFDSAGVTSFGFAFGKRNNSSSPRPLAMHLTGARPLRLRCLQMATSAIQRTALWIYCIAPRSGCSWQRNYTEPGAHAVICAKLHHHNRKRCIFRCGYQAS